VVAALEREHQALAAAGVAHQLQRVLHRLRTADVEMHAPLHAEATFDLTDQRVGELDLLRVQVLARHLRQGVELALDGVVDARVGVAEIDGRMPHLQIEVRPVP
jgi:hypothetical protein